MKSIGSLIAVLHCIQTFHSGGCECGRNLRDVYLFALHVTIQLYIWYTRVRRCIQSSWLWLRQLTVYNEFNFDVFAHVFIVHCATIEELQVFVRSTMSSFWMYVCANQVTIPLVDAPDSDGIIEPKKLNVFDLCRELVSFFSTALNLCFFTAALSKQQSNERISIHFIIITIFSFNASIFNELFRQANFHRQIPQC